MQNIDGTLYKTNKICRDIVDEMIAAENKRMKIQRSSRDRVLCGKQKRLEGELK